MKNYTKILEIDAEGADNLYIIYLLSCIINIGLKTVDILNELPKLKFE